MYLVDPAAQLDKRASGPIWMFIGVPYRLT